MLAQRPIKADAMALLAAGYKVDVRWSDYPLTPPQTKGESPGAEPKSGLAARIKIVMLAT